MVGTFFNYFLEKVWYPDVRKRTSSNVCILLDNCAAHGDLLPQLPGVEYLFLPPNVTSVYQPLDMGLLQSIKLNARRWILHKLIENVERYDELHKLGKLQKPGMKVLNYCHPAHVLDGIRAIHYAYSLVTPSKVSSCWIKAGILSIEHVNEICDKHNLRFPRNYENTPGFVASGGTLSDVVDENQMERNDIEESTSDTFSDIFHALTSVENKSVLQNVDEKIENWLAQLSNEEGNRTRSVDKNPEEFVQYIENIQTEQEKEASESLAREQKERERVNLRAAVEEEKRSYANLKANYEWLEKIVTEGISKNLDDQVHAKLVDTLRTAKLKMLEAAPKQKQKCIGDFFSVAENE